MKSGPIQEARAWSADSLVRVRRSFLEKSLRLPWSLRAGTERGVYSASAWHSPCDVVDFPERREGEDGEAA